jgi:hypothetical protein
LEINKLKVIIATTIVIANYHFFRKFIEQRWLISMKSKNTVVFLISLEDKRETLAHCNKISHENPKLPPYFTIIFRLCIEIFSPSILPPLSLRLCFRSQDLKPDREVCNKFWSRWRRRERLGSLSLGFSDARA